MSTLEPINPAPHLTTQEAYDLGILEQKVQRGLKTFVEVGTALMEIRERKLYRQHYGTFEDYCQERWSFNRHRASQLIAASEVAVGLPAEMVKNLTTESHAAALAKAPTADRPAILQKVMESGSKITAKVIKEAVEGSKDAPAQAKETPRTEPVTVNPAAPAQSGKIEFVSWAMRYAEMAISQLEKIEAHDKERAAALSRVKEWIEQQEEKP